MTRKPESSANKKVPPASGEAPVRPRGKAMKRPAPKNRAAAEPRRRVEKILAKQKPKAIVSKGGEDSQRLLHELQVHQIELEMQNEELRRAQQELEASHARYVDLYDLAPVGYLTLNGCDVITGANLAAAELLGTSRSLLAKKRLVHFILREDQDVLHRHRRALSEGSPQRCELRLQRPDGSTVWARLDATAIPDDTGGAPSCRITLADITARKEAAEALRRLNEELDQRVRERTAELAATEARLRALVEQIPAVTYTAAIDEGSSTLYVSPQIQTLLGFTPAEYAGDPDVWRRQLHPEDRGRVMRQVRVSHRTHKPFFSEYRMLTRAGKIIWVRDHAALVKDAQGKPLVLQGVMYDISERKQMEAELAQSQEELRALLARLEQAREEERIRIARDIHDDFGQTLTAIKMDLRQIGKIAGEAPLTPPLEAILERTLGAIELADTAQAMVQELASQLRPGVLDRLGLGPALQYEARRFHKRHGIECTVALSDESPDLAPDVVTALFRIFQECLTNVARHARATQVHAELKAAQDRVCLRIQDNGTGISEEVLASPASLGLVGMRERAAGLGGAAAFACGEKGGTVVEVSLPLHNPSGTRGGGGARMRRIPHEG